MNYKYYEFASEKFKCPNCNWTGSGAEAKTGEVFGALFEIDCPNCGETLGSVSFPTDKETLEHGSEKEKESVLKRIAFLEKMDATLLKSIDQLPEIKGDELVFETAEERRGDDLYLKILCQGDLVWEEITGYEYYDRFLELGNMFKEKYGESMVDFIQQGSAYLYGDSISAYQKVEEFRKKLKG
jgi:phage FluMu protein Com